MTASSMPPSLSPDGDQLDTSSSAPLTDLKITQDDFEQALTGMLNQVIGFARHAGMESDSVRRVLRQMSTEGYGATGTAAQTRRFDALVAIADVLNAWHAEPAYLTEAGHPKPLSITGDTSFATLCHLHCPTLDAAIVAQLLTAEGILRQLPNGRLRPAKRAVTVATLNALSLERFRVLHAALLSTWAHNMDPEKRALGTHLERSVTVTAFPRARLPEFIRYVKRAAYRMLDATDNWAYQQRGEYSPGTASAEVGLTIFSHERQRASSPKDLG